MPYPIMLTLILFTMFDKNITTKHGICGYRIKNSNNLFPTQVEESANHQTNEVYFGNWRCANVWWTKDAFTKIVKEEM